MSEQNKANGVTSAEDFYGNDYPEDEVDSDDEYGRDAYQYRHHASDDDEEGFEDDDGNNYWSSDEEDKDKDRAASKFQFMGSTEKFYRAQA